MCETTRIATAELAGFARGLSTMPAAYDDTDRIDRITALENLKCAVAAAQAAETAAFVASQRAANIARGLPESRADRGIASQVALARRVSTYQAQRYTGWATILTTELPATFAALQAGRVSEWRAMIVARETAWLSCAHRSSIDADLAARLPELGDRRLEAAVRQAAYRLDPHGYRDRLAAAEKDRRVGLRPAPDVMARLTALLPLAQAVAAYAALRRHADTLIAAGDPRKRGQIMADTLVERLTGQASADGVPVEIELIMTSTSLFGDAERAAKSAAASDSPTSTDATGSAVDGATAGAGRDEPAFLVGCGPVPAAWARRLALWGAESTPRWLRRLYRDPTTGQLAAMDSDRRLFTTAQQRFLRLRDQDICRTPWCDAPVRHYDHVLAVEQDGVTEVGNGEGLCAACNFAKQAPGWRARPSGTAGPPGEITLVTPTGHAYRHRPPDPPGVAPPKPFYPAVA